MTSNLIVEQGRIGRRAVLTGSWNPRVGELIRREEIPELYLNHARGWRGQHVEFLSELPGLLGFGILDLTIDDILPIHQLGQLEYLEVATYCDTPVDFGRFPRLRACSLYWRADTESLFDCGRLE